MTWAAIVISVLLFLLSLIIGLLGFIFKQLRDEIRRNTAAIEDRVRDNTRHLGAVMQSIWNLTWRVNGVEDYLDDTTEFRPPRMFGTAEEKRQKP